MKSVFAILIMGSIVLGAATSAEAAKSGGKKMGYNDAKTKCLEEDPGLAGKSLQSCIKKMQKKKKKSH